MVRAAHPRIVVAGAGSIGCYVGGCLALAGRDVTLLLRPALAEIIAGHGLRISDLDGADRTLAPAAVKLATDPAAAFAEAEIMLVTVKSGATAAMADLIAEHAPSGVTVVSLQNGVGNVDVLLARVGGMGRVVPGMVPFNVVQTHGDGQAARFHRATSGTILIGAGVPGLREALNVKGAAVAEHADMAGVLWGKLLLNLNNALNALSGVPLATQLADRRWRLHPRGADRRGAGRAEGRRHPPGPHRGRAAGRRSRASCGCPTGCSGGWRGACWRSTRRRARPCGRTCERGRATEIDYLQGAILKLAQKSGVRAPLTERIIALVKQAEAARRGLAGA